MSDRTSPWAFIQISAPGLVQTARILAVLDDFDDLSGNTLAERLRLVRCPLKLAVELTIDAADSKTRLEDLSLPYRSKRWRNAQIAREAGLK